jgi:hypothetical protein
MSEDRLDLLEQRMAKVERDLQGFQTTVVKKLTEALQLIQKHQRLRDARVNQQLKKIADELTAIRERLTKQAAVPPVMN